MKNESGDIEKLLESLKYEKNPEELILFLPLIMKFDPDKHFSNFYHFEQNIDENNRKYLTEMIYNSNSVKFKYYMELSNKLRKKFKFGKRSIKRKLDKVLKEEGLI